MTKILIVLLALVAFTFAVEVAKDEGVLVLNQDNFDEVIKEHSNILVEFYAPWCGHCKKLAPEYVKAAEKLAAENPPIALAKIDAVEQKELANKFGVKGYPTLKWFVNGEPRNYNGGRTADEIFKWVQKKLGPLISEITDDKIEELKKEQRILTVFYGSPDAEEFKSYEQLALEDESNTYYYITNSSKLPSGLTAPGIAVFRQFDDPVVVHKGKFTLDDLRFFVTDASIPILFELGKEYFELIFFEKNPAVTLFINKNDEEHQKILSVFDKAAHALKDRILFTYSGVEDEFQKKFADHSGVLGLTFPKLMVFGFEDEKHNKYLYDGDAKALSVDDIVKFVHKFHSRELVKYFKSEEIPDTNDEPVKVVVHKNFDQIVGHDSDVLLEFYAPWCKHCKALEPKYNELATELKDAKGIIIAKCDGTKNEIEGIKPKGYPSIKFFPKGKKTPIDYTGDREVEGFKKFLAENSESYKAHISAKEDL